jgi:hypothetical protein
MTFAEYRRLRTSTRRRPRRRIRFARRRPS